MANALQPSFDSEQRPLRVMFLNTSLHVGGAEVLEYNLIQRFDRARIAPEVCCLKEPGELAAKLAAAGVPVHANVLRNKFDARVLPRLIRLLKMRRIDAVVTVGAGDKMFWGRLAAKLAGVPVIVSAIHSTGWPDGIGWLNRRLHRLNDAFIAVAEPHARFLIDVQRLSPNRVAVIPNGVDTEKYRPQSVDTKLLAELNIPRGAPLVGIVAVLRPEKNHELFFRAATRVRQEVPDARFLIIGDGPRRAELERLTTELNLNDAVHFLGKRADIVSLLNLLDVFVLCSHVEANPVSILEALACGKPVVATRVGSIGESVRDGETGFLVTPGDEAELAAQATKLLHNPALAQRLGTAGRQLVQQQSSLESMVAGYESLLTRLGRQKTGWGEQSTRPDTSPLTTDMPVTPNVIAAQ